MPKENESVTTLRNLKKENKRLKADLQECSQTCADLYNNLSSKVGGLLAKYSDDFCKDALSACIEAQEKIRKIIMEESCNKKQ